MATVKNVVAIPTHRALLYEESNSPKPEIVHSPVKSIAIIDYTLDDLDDG